MYSIKKEKKFVVNAPRNSAKNLEILLRVLREKIILGHPPPSVDSKRFKPGINSFVNTFELSYMTVPSNIGTENTTRVAPRCQYFSIKLLINVNIFIFYSQHTLRRSFLL